MTIDEARDLVRNWSAYIRREAAVDEDEAAALDSKCSGVLALLDELDARRKAAGYTVAVTHTSDALLAEDRRRADRIRPHRHAAR